MTPYAVGYALGQLIMLLAFLIPVFLFLRAQQKALTIVRPEHRRMHPGLVWLQLIPVFNYVWMFFVVRRIADSLAREYAGRESDSIFAVADEEAVKAYGKRPTYGIGMAYCILIICIPLALIFFNLVADPARKDSLAYAWLGLSMVVFGLAGIVCWIVYWVQLAGYKNKLKQVYAEW